MVLPRCGQGDRVHLRQLPRRQIGNFSAPSETGRRTSPFSPVRAVQSPWRLVRRSSLLLLSSHSRVTTLSFVIHIERLVPASDNGQVLWLPHRSNPRVCGALSPQFVPLHTSPISDDGNHLGVPRFSSLSTQHCPERFCFPIASNRPHLLWPCSNPCLNQLRRMYVIAVLA